MTDQERLLFGAELVCAFMRVQIGELLRTCPGHAVEVLSCVMGTGVGFCKALGIDPVELVRAIVKAHAEMAKDDGAPRPVDSK